MVIYSIKQKRFFYAAFPYLSNLHFEQMTKVYFSGSSKKKTVTGQSANSFDPLAVL